MNPSHFQTTILVDRPPVDVFNAIANVRGWWSEDIEGPTDHLNAVYLYHYKDIHICKIKITEFVPNEKVTWLVLENHFNFTKDKTEWNGNTMHFTITQQGAKTQLVFEQIGLVPAYECFEICQNAWTTYIQKSLFQLIESGVGIPNPKDGEGFNAELARKWNLE